MKLLRSLIPQLADALLNMDGDPKKPFKYSVQTRYGLGKNLRILSTQVADFEKARQGKIREIAPADHSIKPGTPEMVRFSTEWDAFMEETVEVKGILCIKLADLNLDSNELPIAVIAKLGPILIEDDAPSA